MADWGGVGGRRVVITGATTGIGLAASLALAELGAHLTIVARDQGKAAEAVEAIRAAAGDGAVVEVAFADLASQSGVRDLAADLLARHERIDVLINNAGAMFRTRQLTDDGIEMTWALNHLAPFLLTNLLADRLTQHPSARILTTASDAHRKERLPLDDVNAERSYRSFGRYGETKLANIAFTAELARRLAGSGVTANAMHPGLVATGFNRNNGRRANAMMTTIRPFARTPAQGAETLVWLADAEEVSGVTGAYFVDRRQVAPNAEAQDPALARRLWDLSARQVGLHA